MVLRSGQAEAALRSLRAEGVEGPVAVLGNNLGDYDAQAEAAGPENFVLGFGSFGGYRDGPLIRYLDGRTLRKPSRYNKTTLGVIASEARPALSIARGIIEGAGLPCVESEDIRSWLITHAALVFPLAGAIYAVGGDQERFCRDRKTILLGIRGCKECMGALLKAGFTIEPGSVRRLMRVPEWLLVRMLARSFRGEGARVSMFGHANAPGGRGEISGQASALDGLIRAPGAVMPSWDRLLEVFAFERT